MARLEPGAACGTQATKSAGELLDSLNGAIMPRVVEENDNQLLNDFRNTLVADVHGELTRDLEPLRADIPALKQRSSRPPGGSSGPPELDTCEPLGLAFMREPAVTAYLRNPKPGGIRIELNRPVLTTRKATAITSFTAYGPPTIRPGVVTRPRRRLVLRDVLGVYPLTTATLTYVVETAPVPASPGAAYQVAEGDPKVEISIGTTPATCTPSTLAAWVTCSRQVLDDAMYLQQFIDERLVYEVGYVEERELINGDGTPGHIKGFLTVATPYDTARTLAGDTNLDTPRSLREPQPGQVNARVTPSKSTGGWKFHPMFQPQRFDRAATGNPAVGESAIHRLPRRPGARSLRPHPACKYRYAF
jgi:HK97 family phage major capsid protein